MNEEQEKQIKHSILTGNWRVRRYSRARVPGGFLGRWVCALPVGRPAASGEW